MKQDTFLLKLKQKVKKLDLDIQSINDEIGLLKGLIIDYESSIHEDDNLDSRDVFPGSTPYFGVFKDDKSK